MRVPPFAIAAAALALAAPVFLAGTCADAQRAIIAQSADDDDEGPPPPPPRPARNEELPYEAAPAPMGETRRIDPFEANAIELKFGKAVPAVTPGPQVITCVAGC